MDLAPFAAFMVASVVGLGLSLATFFVARKAGLASVQNSLIDTLQDNAAALAKRVDLLEEEVDALREVRQDLEKEVQRLRDAVSDLAAENAELRRKLNMPPRAEKRP